MAGVSERIESMLSMHTAQSVWNEEEKFFSQISIRCGYSEKKRLAFLAKFAGKIIRHLALKSIPINDT